jgi:aerotaxis receptor
MAEIFLSNEDFLVSETDEKGRILFVNDDFVKISGFSLKELINQPHNIIRHPDMPKTAFKDLWETVQKGDIWQGYVKNLCKNGDYYWVYSSIYPIINCQGNKGYISCRKSTSKEENLKYENIYKEMRQKEN